MVQVCPFSQVEPSALQVSTISPSQRPASGVQGASQRPLLQVSGQFCWKSQALPVGLQTSTWVPLHRRSPGVQAWAVAQLPFTQP